MPCGRRDRTLARVFERAARLAALLVIAVTIGACARGDVVPAPTASTAPTVAAVSPSPTGTPSLAATPAATATAATATPTSAPTASAVPTPAGPAAYCSVGDVLTPNRDLADHVRTYLDWTYALPETYRPTDLVNATTGAAVKPTPFAVEFVGAAEVLARRGDPSYSTLLSDAPDAAVRKLAFDDLAALRTAALRAAHPLVVLSAYRSYNLQQLTFDYWVRVGGYEQALRTSARAGHSEHQLGTVLDFGDGSAAPWEYADWATTPSGAWLSAHAAEYGFVMSYPKGTTNVTCYDYEPWHYRWVGRDLAMQLVAAGTPLRAYQATGLR